MDELKKKKGKKNDLAWNRKRKMQQILCAVNIIYISRRRTFVYPTVHKSVFIGAWNNFACTKCVSLLLLFSWDQRRSCTFIAWYVSGPAAIFFRTYLIANAPTRLRKCIETCKTRFVRTNVLWNSLQMRIVMEKETSSQSIGTTCRGGKKRCVVLLRLYSKDN
jgi:hypothetical protein